MRFLIIIFFFISAISNSQSIEIGEFKTITSKILNEERDYSVYLPEHYNDENFSNQKYPVIYLLDGEKYFHVTSGIVKNLSQGFYPQIPECIVVAINNTDRSRDLTPTKVSELPYKSGGSETFELYLQNELIPLINKEYRTLGYNILIGHSFGGLFAINTMLNSSNLFNAYLAIDPSLWWDNALLLKKIENLPETSFQKIKLFLANANSYKLQKDLLNRYLDHYNAKNKFIKFSKEQNYKDFSFYSKFYKNEDHGSVVLPSIIDGLRYIFKGFRINVRDLIKNPGLLEETYKKFSKEVYFNFKPQSFYIDKVVDFAIKNKLDENAKILHQFNLKTYPENTYLKYKIN